MKRICICLFVFICVDQSGFAQQRMEPGSMNYLYAPKPNSILYHDTLFKGSKQFRQLFFRQHDPALMLLYDKHQSNKIFGQIFGITGTLQTHNKSITIGLIRFISVYKTYIFNFHKYALVIILFFNKFHYFFV